MASPRLCPHCEVTIPIDHGFSFDENLNMLCDSCHKIVYPAVEGSEIDSTPAYKSTTYKHNYQPSYGQHQQHDSYSSMMG